MNINKHRVTQYLLIVGLLCVSWSVQASGVSRSAMLAMSCAGCHGPDGNSPGAIPTIAGKSSQFIAKALKDFRDGSMPLTVMGRHAKGYTDDEINLIAKYFAGK